MSMARRAFTAALVLAGCALSSAASAHPNTVAYGDLRLDGAVATLDIYVAFRDWDALIKLDADGDELLTQAEVSAEAERLAGVIKGSVMAWNGEARCPTEVLAPRLTARQGQPYVMSPIRFVCEAAIAELTLRYDLFTRVHEGHKLLARVQGAQKDATLVFQTHPRAPAEKRIRAAAPPQSFTEAFTQIFVWGVEHIWIGYDHILFLLALIIAGGSLKRLIGIVTAFSVAHSITLALAALDLVQLPIAAVEAVIAASIVFVAIENLVLRELSLRRRLVVTFVFGLVHGFGFASVLGDLAVDRQSLTAGLFSFNLGVEVGQVTIVAILYPFLRWLESQEWHERAVRGVSTAIAVMGLYWLVERTLL